MNIKQRPLHHEEDVHPFMLWIKECHSSKLEVATMGAKPIDGAPIRWALIMGDDVYTHRFRLCDIFAFCLSFTQEYVYLI